GRQPRPDLHPAPHLGGRSRGRPPRGARRRRRALAARAAAAGPVAADPGPPGGGGRPLRRMPDGGPGRLEDRVAAAPGLDAPPEGSAAEVELRLYAELQDFLPADRRGGPVRRPHRPHQTVKDLIEAVGVPHSEVELVVVEGEVVDFSHRPAAGDRIAVYPAFRRLDLGPLPRLHPPWPEQPRFAADVHLGRLARLLRLLGFDVRWANDLDDDELAAVAEAEGRVVLTADRGLLKRNQVVHGVFVRPGDAVEQAVEVLRRLDLGGRLAPFTRCLVCGGELDEVPK